ncbi:NACHT domain-containing protein [Corynascus similis CBS 632.67]
MGRSTRRFTYRLHASFSERDAQCLKDLGVTDPPDDKARIEEEKVLSNVDFQRWHDDGGGQLLWVRGDPGKGKTMLLCGIIDELQTIAPTANISFFFCQAMDDRINNATTVLRGYDGFGKQRFEGPNSSVALSRIFTSILKDLESALSRTYLIIDAVDECTGDPDKLLSLVTQKTSEHPSIKWIVSSRNWPSIEKGLNTATQKVKLSLELNKESISAAVTRYILLKVDWLAERNGYSNDIRDAIERYLSENAQGTFLWVALVCQQLANTFAWEAEELLRTFPPGLDALYRRMIDQIYMSRHAKLLLRILAVVSVVYRPITLEEMPALVDIPEIVGLCGSFLTLRERIVSLVHQSAKDFLLIQARDEIFPSGMEHVHYTIFSRSLRAMHGTLRRNIYNLSAPGDSIDIVTLPDPDPLALVRYSNADKDLQDGGSIATFLREKFLYWLEALSLLKCMSEGLSSILELKRLSEVSSW